MAGYDDDVARLLQLARVKRLDVTPDNVIRHYKWYMRWERGFISTGQLMGRTGVKFRPKVTLARKVGMVVDAITAMLDTTGSSVNVDMKGPRYIAGYVSGSDGVEWTPENWDVFGDVVRVRIYQGNGPIPAFDMFDVIDVESGAVGPQQAADIIKSRVQAGVEWTTVYAGDQNANAVSQLVQAMGPTIWVGHVNLWYANWNLDDTHAAELIGTEIHGMTCIGVQYASPKTNPNTLIPGTDVTLSKANADLSVVDATWVPSGGWGAKPTPTPTPVATTRNGILFELPDGPPIKVTSTDDGKTWV